MPGEGIEPLRGGLARHPCELFESSFFGHVTQWHELSELREPDRMSAAAWV
jgi:hypothetical protein